MNDMKSIRFPPPVADEMIRAILEGRKTVTRRMVKLEYSNTHLEMFTNKYGTRLIEKQNFEPGVTIVKHPDGSETRKLLAYIEKTPPYRPGNILYVRETWNYGYCDTTDFEFQYNETFFEELSPGSQQDTILMPRYFYRTEDLDGIVGMKWKPSIHMPKEAARLFLRVSDVRVERLQEMTDDDFVCDFGVCREAIQAVGRDALAISFWDSTIKKTADRALYGWAANPWVWVIEFERCGKPGGEGE